MRYTQSISPDCYTCTQYVFQVCLSNAINCITSTDGKGGKNQIETTDCIIFQLVSWLPKHMLICRDG